MKIRRNETEQQFLSRRLQALKTERSTWDSHWMDINEFILPRRGRFLGMGTESNTSAAGANRNPNDGRKINDKIIDSTATHALNILTSGLMSGVTSPARKWFRLVTPDAAMMKHSAVSQWIEIVERLMYDIFDSTNLYQMLPYIYEEMGAYGTAALVHLPDFENVVRFQAMTIGEYWVSQNHKYEVDTMFREVPMTCEQIVTRYGDRSASPAKRWANFSPAVQNAWDRGDYDTWFDTVHVICPNHEGYVEGSTKKTERKFKQVVYEKGQEGDGTKVLQRSGHKRFPVYVPRWHLMPPDVYGRSPGMDALGDVKQLQDQQKKKGLAIAKMVNPPMTADPRLKNERMTTLPGDVTFADAQQGRAGFAPAYMVQPRLNEFVMDMEDVRQRIRTTMFADLFLMISQMDRRQVTATEIEVRNEEKLLALGPVLERIDNDLLRKLIDNTFEDMLEAGIVPDPPRELEGVELKVEYMSIISMAQRAQGLLGIQDTVNFAASLAQAQVAAGQEPTAMDKINIDETIDDYATKRGVPAPIVRSQDEVQEMRDGRNQQKAQMAAMATAQQAADTAKTLSDTKTTGDNLMAELGIPNAGQGPGGVNVR